MASVPATTVDGYLKGLPEDRRAVIARLREIARRTLPGFTEGMEYGMPYYRRGRSDAVGFASKAQHIAIYVGRDVLAAHGTPLGAYDVGKGCVRFSHPDRIDWELVEAVFRTAAGPARPRGPVRIPVRRGSGPGDSVPK
jgi:uncharacterized protein YdhG (YjbR/CyaY superfamily)